MVTPIPPKEVVPDGTGMVGAQERVTETLVPDSPSESSPGAPSTEKESHPAIKPWYTDVAKVIGVAGFVLAVATMGERFWVRKQEETQQRLQQLRDVTSALSDVQVEYMKALYAANGSNVYQLGVAMNTKRQMLIQTASALLADRRVEKQTSAQVFGTIGGELMNDGRYADARAQFEKALGAPTIDPNTRVWILRTLGHLFSQPDTGFQNAKTATRYYEESLGLLKNRRDDAGHLTWAETCLMRASMELVYGEKSNAIALARQARERLAQVRSLSPLRTQLETIAATLERGEQYDAQGSRIQTAGETVVDPRSGAASQRSPEGASLSTDTSSGAMSSDETPRGAAGAATSPGSATAEYAQAVVELWPLAPGLISGAELTLHVDGREVGTISNLRPAQRLALPSLPIGTHRFEITRLSVYFVDAQDGPVIKGSNLRCDGMFELSATREVLKLDIASGFYGLVCALH